MIEAQQRPIARQPSIRIVAARAGLAAIHRPGCPAAVWHRPTAPAFLSWLARLPPEHLPRIRVILRPEEVRSAVEAACAEAGMPAGDPLAAFVEDVVLLAETFAETMRAPYLRCRLDVITSNACRRFHIDAVTARLICTYRGSGTQMGVSTDGGDPSQIFAVPAGAPLVLRGTRWPELPPSGLLHRSPPIEGTGETRLLLVLDPIDDPDSEI